MTVTHDEIDAFAREIEHNIQRGEILLTEYTGTFEPRSGRSKTLEQMMG